MKIICINNKHRPNEIRDINWLHLGDEYTVVKLLKSVITGEQFYELAEVKPDSPYGGYKITRFAIPESEILKFCDMFNVDIPTDDDLLELLKEKQVLEEDFI
jgi:hypothetical protein